MKIALLGYGKMGRAIEKIAMARGHEIVLRKASGDNDNGLEDAYVAIEFSTPDAAVGNISTCFDKNIPVVSGTTGWLAHYDRIVSHCNEKKGAFIYGSNFSLGVNIFFGLNEYLAKVMRRFPEYRVDIEETHHTEKRDAPSGTAISLAKGIIDHSDYSSWALGKAKHADEVPIEAKRIENVPGTHSVVYRSPVDEIEIKHIAHNRDGFALGAVMAAEWLAGKEGVFTMKDVLGLEE